ncbi:uncharacterized protein LOC772381 isoform X2 [Gallus gallus]|uniref:uncharacterized protein LOC772381 isoform X2 n=1 Tax=Gallus gallus TaxID=9031 RepID=UPI001AE1FDE6|nr:uncharacterized protein LOC772381 isoform X2 [Gallus gallus]XP_040506445.1 uncharacterized protein LOC772381 isoform X2 [Gallus gallus]
MMFVLHLEGGMLPCTASTTEVMSSSTSSTDGAVWNTTPMDCCANNMLGWRLCSAVPSAEMSEGLPRHPSTLNTSMRPLCPRKQEDAFICPLLAAAANFFYAKARGAALIYLAASLEASSRLRCRHRMLGWAECWQEKTFGSSNWKNTPLLSPRGQASTTATQHRGTQRLSPGSPERSTVPSLPSRSAPVVHPSLLSAQHRSRSCQPRCASVSPLLLAAMGCVLSFGAVCLRSPFPIHLGVPTAQHGAHPLMKAHSILIWPGCLSHVGTQSYRYRGKAAFLVILCPLFCRSQLGLPPQTGNCCGLPVPQSSIEALSHCPS